ncbi:MAG: SDR family oxidoreductase [Schleiferiaceae bacterium]|nr:SDR family oxidoreductase [Schleiferiaceae bacterium]
MKNNLDRYGKCAMVIGGAEGLGLAYSKRLATLGFRVLMIDKNQTQLENSIKALDGHPERNHLPVLMDASAVAADQELFNLIQQNECRIVVYNAAYGPVKKFLENSIEELETYSHLHGINVLKLSYRFAKHWLHGEPSAFIGMSSMGALRGTKLVAPYASTKASIWVLMESLYYEFKGTNLDFICCISGTINTPHFKSITQKKSGFKPKDLEPEQVVEEVFRSIGKKAICVPGRANRLVYFLLKHFMSHRRASAITNETIEKMYTEQWAGGYQR